MAKDSSYELHESDSAANTNSYQVTRYEYLPDGRISLQIWIKSYERYPVQTIFTHFIGGYYSVTKRYDVIQIDSVSFDDLGRTTSSSSTFRNKQDEWISVGRSFYDYYSDGSLKRLIKTRQHYTAYVNESTFEDSDYYVYEY